MESGNGKKLDLELLFKQIGGTFNSDKEVPEEHGSLQERYLPKLANEQPPKYEDSTSDKDGYECAATESGEEIVDETTLSSLMKDLSKNKSCKVVIPEAQMRSDSEDEPPRPQPRKRNRASPALLRAGGHSKYF